MLRPMPDDDAAAAAIELRPWSPDDLDLMTALLGDPAMTEHLGGPESPEQLRRRLDKYLAMTPADGRMFVITLGAGARAGGLRGLLAARVGLARDRLERAAGVPGARRGDAAAPSSASTSPRPRAATTRIHAYPSVDNAASNALCRRLGFELLGQDRFEYPKGHWMTCNDWSLDLRERARATARYEIIGERVALGPSGASCIRCTVTWLNDPEVAWNVFGAPVSGRSRTSAHWIEQYLADRDPPVADLSARRGAADRPRGAHRDRRRPPAPATFRTFIGEARDRGQGFGRESSELVIRHALRGPGPARDPPLRLRLQRGRRCASTSGSASGRSSATRCSSSATAAAGTSSGWPARHPTSA